jgi:hypothetical protein
VPVQKFPPMHKVNAWQGLVNPETMRKIRNYENDDVKKRLQISVTKPNKDFDSNFLILNF